jgi:hypothetical protein
VSAVTDAIEELKREIPDAYYDEALGEVVLILTRRSAETALRALNTVTEGIHYGILYGDETETWYVGDGPRGLKRAQEKFDPEFGDEIMQRSVLRSIGAGYGPWEPVR